MLIATLTVLIAGTSGQDPGAVAQEVTFETCAYTGLEDRDPACAPILEAAAAPVPEDLLGAPPNGPAGSNPWVEQRCARENLRPGQTTYACRQEADAVYARARLAHRALNGLPNYGALRASAEYQAAAARGDVAAGPEAQGPSDRDRCRRSGSSWRDEDTGNSESRYRLTCSWGDDPAAEAAARRMLDDLLDRR